MGKSTAPAEPACVFHWYQENCQLTATNGARYTKKPQGLGVTLMSFNYNYTQPLILQNTQTTSAFFQMTGHTLPVQ